MGQSASRSSRQSPSGPSPSRTDITPPAGSSTRTNGQAVPSISSSEPSTSTERRSRRRSVFNLVSRSRTSSSEQKDKDAPSRRHSTPLRKIWRSSRRFSKTPSQLDPSEQPSVDTNTSESAHDRTLHEVLPITPAETPSIAGPSHSSRPSTPFPNSRPVTPPNDSSADGPRGRLSQEERRLSENIGNWLSGSSSTTGEPSQSYSTSPEVSHPDSVDIEREIHELLSSPQGDNEGLPAGIASSTTDDTIPPLESTTPMQIPPRHFPPPGTLVVVQGVVNTTDAPPAVSQNAARTMNTSAPPPPPPESLLVPPPQRRSSSAPRSSRAGNVGESSRRTGLSSLVPRPTSMISRRPSTSSRTSAMSPSNRYSEPPHQSDPMPVHAQESTSSSGSTESSQGSDADTVTPTDSEGGAHALSPGSIDVLGTLLRYVSYLKELFDVALIIYPVLQLQPQQPRCSLLVFRILPIQTPQCNLPLLVQCHQPQLQD